MSLRFTFPVLVALLMVACSAERSGPGEALELHYLELLGQDTFSVESFRWHAGGFEGKVCKRSPLTEVGAYEGRRDDRGYLDYFRIVWSTPIQNPEGRPERRFEMWWHQHDYLLVWEEEGVVDSAHFQAPAGALPVGGKIPIPFALLHQLFEQYPGEKPETVTFLNAGDPEVWHRDWEEVAPDTFRLDLFGTPMLASWQNGRVEWRSGRHTPIKVEGHLVSRLDIDNLATYFARLDAAGKGMGIASPPATVEASINGATMRIEYSQPAARGRKVWGGLIPFDEVWRTGANAATKLTADTALFIGGYELPPGSYSLWSMHSSERSFLIVNSESEVWGTAHDPSRDIYRIPLARSWLNDPVERFRISVERYKGQHHIVLEWGKQRFSVPLTIHGD